MKHTVLLVALVLTACVAGCGGGGGGGGSTNAAPTVTSLSVVPSQLGYTGGTVTITAQATDDSQVASVSASVAGPSGTETVALTAAGNDYAGTYTAAGNLGPGAAAYSVSVTATDDDGATSDAATAGFTVASISPPPPRPT